MSGNSSFVFYLPLRNFEDDPRLTLFHIGDHSSGIISKSLRLPVCFEWTIFLVIAVYFFMRFAPKKEVLNDSIIHYEDFEPSRIILPACCFGLIFLCSPVIITGLLCFALYRKITHTYLTLIYGNQYAGLMKGSDVMWAIDTAETKSIINALLMLEVPREGNSDKDGNECGERILHLVRKIASETFLDKNSLYPKLRCLKKKSLSQYYFWKEMKSPPMDELVKSTNLTHQCLKDFIGSCSNKPLPLDDSAMWEILVSQQPISLDDQKIWKFPIVFRIHHSVGDGVALLRLLIEGIASKYNYSIPKNFKQEMSLFSEEKSAGDFGERVEDGSDKEDRKLKEPEILMSSDCKKATVVLFKRLPKNGSSTSRKEEKFRENYLTGKIPSRSLGYSVDHITPPSIMHRKDYAPIRSSSMSSKIPVVRKPVKKPCRESIINMPSQLCKGNSSDSLLVRGSTVDTKKETCCEDTIDHAKRFEKCASHRSSIDNSAKRNMKNFSKDEKHRFKMNAPHPKEIAIGGIVSLVVTAVCLTIVLKLLNRLYDSYLGPFINFLFFAPYAMLRQFTYNPVDTILYGKQLSGEKVVSWLTERGDSESCLQSKIRRIRNRLNGKVTFSDVLFTCLSRSLTRYYVQCGGPVPSSVNIVLPARVDLERLQNNVQSESSEQIGKKENLSNSSCALKDSQSMWSRIIATPATLENKFTVAMIEIPILDTVESKDTNSLVQCIQRSCRAMRSSPSLIANYWLLRYIAHVLPTPILSTFINSAPCSLVLSNLPGPDNAVFIDGKPISEIVFWVPNRGLNGVGISMLSYRGRFSIGIIADKALIPSSNDAHKIIQGLISEVESLEEETTTNVLKSDN